MNTAQPYLIILLTGLMSVATPAAAQTQTTAGGAPTVQLTLADAEARALDRNPTLAQAQLRACKEITACTVDRRVVRCARGGGHPAGKACSAGARAHGAIAPGVGGD